MKIKTKSIVEISSFLIIFLIFSIHYTSAANYLYDQTVLTVTCSANCPLNPDATGTYVLNGTYNSFPAYERTDGAYWIWGTNLFYWFISQKEGGNATDAEWQQDYTLIENYSPWNSRAHGTAAVNWGNMFDYIVNITHRQLEFRIKNEYLPKTKINLEVKKGIWSYITIKTIGNNSVVFQTASSSGDISLKIRETKKIVLIARTQAITLKLNSIANGKATITLFD